MLRAPFVWEVHVRRELIEQELDRLRELPYSLWRELVGRTWQKTTRGRDDRSYRLLTTVEWAAPGTENLRVTVALETGGFRRRLLSQSFVLTPDNRFQE